ncbi:PQQ-binding-like beta-propeller repeat protein [Streptomyces sp. NPDC018947]|uniref:outer membrane protein assembly factor BamB family protein n=1 Tax=Streptomyces sp. NPDC018947 TaxID=3365054 RepID=UPI00379FFD79
MPSGTSTAASWPAATEPSRRRRHGAAAHRGPGPVRHHGHGTERGRTALSGTGSGASAPTAGSGRRLWRTGIQMPKGAAVSGSALHIAGFGAVTVLDRKTGERRRSYEFEKDWPSDVVPSGRTLCVTDHHDVVGVDTETGRKPWRIDMRSFPDLSAAGADWWPRATATGSA